MIPDLSTGEQTRLIKRLFWRLMPFVTLIYLIAIIDRQNVGFAKLQMVDHLEAAGLVVPVQHRAKVVFDPPIIGHGVTSWLAAAAAGSRTGTGRAVHRSGSGTACRPQPARSGFRP